MTKQIRRKFTPQEKVAIPRQHLLEGKPGVFLAGVQPLCRPVAAGLSAAHRAAGVRRALRISLPTFPPGSIQTKNTFQFGDIACHARAKIP